MTERTELANIMLEKAGWFPGRRVDLEPIREAFSKSGMRLYDEVQIFLEEFDGICLYDEESEPIFSIKSSDGVGFWHSDIAEINRINRHFGVKLTKVGNFDYSSRILISENGLIWFNHYQLSLEHGIETGVDQNLAFNKSAENWRPDGNK
jgi:SUKH-3 immunity protein